LQKKSEDWLRLNNKKKSELSFYIVFALQIFALYFQSF